MDRDRQTNRQERERQTDKQTERGNRWTDGQRQTDK